MKLFYYAAAAAAMASAVFCSCDKQDEVTPPQPEIAPVQFVGVTALDVVTRAEAKPYAADFNVFIPGVTAATKLVKFNADAWTVDGDPILVDRTGGTLVAWAPSALAVTTSASGAEYTLTAQKDAAAQDLIYQPQPVNAANAGAVAVEMKHAYSKLSFLATAGNGYTGAANLTQVQITGGIYATGTLDMVAGTVDPAGTATGALTLAAGEKALVVPMAAGWRGIRNYVDGHRPGGCHLFGEGGSLDYDRSERRNHILTTLSDDMQNGKPQTVKSAAFLSWVRYRTLRCGAAGRYYLLA